jgi:multisubunit Na+/H+ antiporter MnhG subunit
MRNEENHDKTRIIGIIMLVIAAAFIAYALQHPEGSFPLNNSITYIIYVLYFAVMVILLISPFKKKK